MATSQEIEAILRNHIDEFSGATQEDKERDLNFILPKIVSALEIPMEDRRAAAQMEIEAPKLFITMALAAIVLIGTLVQLGWQTFIKDSYVILALCALAATACFFSMYFGVLAINTISKTGGQTDNRWSVEGIKGYKNIQAWVGIVAILLFVSATALSVKSPGYSGNIFVELPGNIQASLPGGIVVTGNWSSMKIEGRNKTTINLGQIPAGQFSSFEIKSR
jgi:hypothetical protein